MQYGGSPQASASTVGGVGWGEEVGGAKKKKKKGGGTIYNYEKNMNQYF